jgi:hypothetical protein
MATLKGFAGNANENQIAQSLRNEVRQQQAVCLNKGIESHN